MYKRPGETYDEYEKRIMRTADILFPTMKEKKKTPKLLKLGEIDYDEDDKNNSSKISSIKQGKSELDALTDPKYEKKNNEHKSRKERTPEEEEEILNAFYPAMKDKNNIIAADIKIPETADKYEDEKKSADESLKNIDNTIFSDKARKKARSFIQKAEICKENAYQDEKGVWTIGYGHTKDVKPGDKITKEEAERLYAEDFKIHSAPLKHVKVPLNDNEKAALASLIFNIGEPQFKNSTVLRKLNEGDKKAAAEAFKLFCKETKKNN